MSQRVDSQRVDIKTAEFLVEFEASYAGPTYCLNWPTEDYRDIVTSPVRVTYMPAFHLVQLAEEVDPSFPDLARVERLKWWFAEMAAGRREGWPELPVLYGVGSSLAFADGRHRCKALAELGALRVPVIVG